MTMFYSKSMGGFYDDSIHEVMPVDAVSVADDVYQAIFADQSNGASIQSDANGNPIPVFPPAFTLAEIQAQGCSNIDSAAQAVYNGIGSSSPGMLAEYQQANADAQAYKAAGYTGAIPATIECWVTASGMTPQAATDNIIETAGAWIGCLNAIRAARLLGKAAVKKATSITDAQAAATAAISQIQAIASAA